MIKLKWKWIKISKLVKRLKLRTTLQKIAEENKTEPPRQYASK